MIHLTIQMVCLGLVFLGGIMVFGFSFVFHVGNESRFALNFVVDCLNATVWEGNEVRSGDDFTVAALLLAKVIVRRLIFDGPIEIVRHTMLKSVNFSLD